jgi:GTPase SAR1 family protein
LYEIPNGKLTEKLEDAQKEIENILKVKEENSFPMVLVGTKSDLENERNISFEEGMELAKKYGIRFFETSSKLNINVEEAILALIDEIHKKRIITEQKINDKKECYVM